MSISVIIPVKNRAYLLPITLNNILDQSLKPYEVIVVDDGSTDNIKEVMGQYNQKVIFIESKGKGPGAARNTGVSIATGKFIQFFDSDDIMTKNKLEIQSRLITEKSVDFVYGPWVKALNENGIWKQLDVIMQYYPIPKGFLADYVLQGWCNITQSALFTSELVKEVGSWREDLLTHEDYEFWFRVGKVARRYIHENRSCILYRQHQQQVTDMQVAEKIKWKNEIAVLDILSNEITFKPSIHSLLMFKGKEFRSKSAYIRKFGNSSDITVNKHYRFFASYYKLCSKWGQIQTGTTWQKMHGTLSGDGNKFDEYLMNI